MKLIILQPIYLLYEGVGHFEQRLAAALGGLGARKGKRNGKESKLEVFERMKMVFSSQGDANRKEAELLSYKRRQEQLQKDLMNTSMENRYTNTQIHKYNSQKPNSSKFIKSTKKFLERTNIKCKRALLVCPYFTYLDIRRL